MKTGTSHVIGHLMVGWDSFKKFLKLFPLSWLRPAPGKASEEHLTAEKIRDRVIASGGAVRFLPVAESYTGETEEMRRTYPLMLKEPVVKAALLTKVLAVAALDVQVTPASEKARDKEASDLVKENLKRVRGGTRALAMGILFGGLISGYSVCEKVWTVGAKGKLKNKYILRALKAKDPEELDLLGDDFRNITGILERRSNTRFNPSNFTVWSHLPLYEVPTGMSDLRAAYRAFWLKDTAWQLRAIGMERYSLPMMKGTYVTDDQKTEMETALAKARSQSWISLPQGAQIEALTLAARGMADFEAALRDLDQEIVLGICGAVLQMLQGQVADGRGSSQVHRATSELLQWMLAAEVGDVFNDQIVPDLVDFNVRGADYPTVTLGGVSDETLLTSANVDNQLLNMGLPLSKEEMYKKYGRQKPTDPQDTLIAPMLMGFGGGGGFAAGGGGAAGAAFAEDEDLDFFCQQGRNRGKPGPCPQGSDGVSRVDGEPGVLGKAKDWVADKVNKLYRPLAHRYGKAGAKVIVGGGLALGLATPLAVVPGSIALGMLPFAAGFELWRQGKRAVGAIKKAFSDGDEHESKVPPEQAALLSRKFARWLAGEWRDHLDGDKELLKAAEAAAVGLFTQRLRREFLAACESNPNKGGQTTPGPCPEGPKEKPAPAAAAAPKPESKKRRGFLKVARDDQGNFLGDDGKPLDAETQERLKKLRIPPAWQNVQVSATGKGRLQATGFDAKGRSQRLYSADATDKARVKKFLRVKAMVAALPQIDEAIRKTLADPKHPHREAAAVLALIRRTGFRIGSNADRRADVKAHGASTLTAQHARLLGDTVSFDFTGKKGVRIQQRFKDPELAALIRERKATAGRKGRLFNTSDSTVRAYLKSLGVPFQVKDFRTVVAAEAALDAMEKLRAPKRLTLKKLKQLKNAVGDRVAARLGNTRAVALKSYVPPEIFAPWEQRLVRG